MSSERHSSTPRTRGHDPRCVADALGLGQHPPYTWARHQPVVVDQSLYPRGRGRCNRFRPPLPTMSEDFRSLSECRSSCASGCLRTFFQHAICTLNGQSKDQHPSTPRARGHDLKVCGRVVRYHQHPPRTWARQGHVPRGAPDRLQHPPHVDTTPASSRRPVVVPTW
jgi:hypothetical protein